MKLSRILFSTVSLFSVLVATHQASADSLITDGTFLGTNLSSPGGYLCDTNTTPSSVCVSNLTFWSATCGAEGCNGSNTPSSLLFAGTDGNLNMSGFNVRAPTYGLFGTLANPPGGGNAIAIDGGADYAGTVFQTVNGLQIGDRYELDFYQAAGQQHDHSGPTTEQWQVSLGGSSQSSTLMNNASQSVVPWNLQTMDFIATSTSEVLSFLAAGTPDGQPPVALLADVSLTDIPEPGTLVLLGVGALGLLAFARRWTRASLT